MASVPEDQDPLLNVVLGGARIQRRVSAGLLANVYLGHYERLNLPVAVKVLSPKAIAQGMSKERFVREGRALAQLSHPNVIKIYNVGHDNGRYFIVMDWIQDGMNLRQLAQSRPLTPAQSLKVVRRLCEAIEYIHSKSLIHRDIKPANICLRKGGHPVLMDFSLIKDQSSDVQLTAPGTIMGTVNFMPPEQAQPGGPFGNVGPWSDVYSLGATLYWLLSGRPPFKGRTPMETIVKLIREPHVPASQINASIPPAIDALVARTLAKRPEERPQAARELMAEIDEIAVTHQEALQRGVPPPIATEDDGAPAAAPAAAPAPVARSWGSPSATPSSQVRAVELAPATAAAQVAAPYQAPPPSAYSPAMAPAAAAAGGPRGTTRLPPGTVQAASAPAAVAAPAPPPAPFAQLAHAQAATYAPSPPNGPVAAPPPADDPATVKIPQLARGAAPPPAPAKPRSWVEEAPAAPSWTDQQKERAAGALGMSDEPSSASAEAPKPEAPKPVSDRIVVPEDGPESDAKIELPRFAKHQAGGSRKLELILIVAGILLVAFCVGLGIILLVTKGAS